MPRIPGLLYVRTGLSEGLTSNDAYERGLQAARNASEVTGESWSFIRKTIFQQMYAGVRYARELVPEAIQAPKDVPLGGLDVPTRPSTVASGYLYSAAAFTRDVNSAELEKTIHLFRSDRQLTPAEVEAVARRQIETSAQDVHGTFGGRVIEGITFSGVERLIQGAHS